MQLCPELARLLLVEEAKRFAQEKMQDPENRAAFAEQVKERGIQELARGETLLEFPNFQQREVECEQE